MGIRDTQAHAPQAPSLELPEELPPGVFRFVEYRLYSQDLPHPRAIHAARNQAVRGSGRAATCRWRHSSQDPGGDGSRPSGRIYDDW